MRLGTDKGTKVAGNLLHVDRAPNGKIKGANSVVLELNIYLRYIEAGL